MSYPRAGVALRRGGRVRALDGEVGGVKGAVVADTEHRVTHVLLQDGRLFGRQDVAITIGAVSGVDEGMELDIGGQQVEDLPSLEPELPAEYGSASRT